MKEFFKMPQRRREKIIKQIKQVLQKREELVFAYVYGSFLEDPVFRDIDVGVYLTSNRFSKEKDSYNYAFSLADEIEKKIGRAPAVDVRILNEAPFYFLNNVFSRGKFLFSRDHKALTDLIETTSRQYIANANISHQSLRELIYQ